METRRQWPETWMLEAGEYTMKWFAAMYGMNYAGTITSMKDAKKLAETVK